MQLLSKFVTPEIAETTTTHLVSFLTISIMLLIQVDLQLRCHQILIFSLNRIIKNYSIYVIKYKHYIHNMLKKDLY